MEFSNVRIKEIVTTKYADFVEYCSMAGKEYVRDLTSVDYIAYRTQYGISRESVSELKKIIETFDPASLEERTEEPVEETTLPEPILEIENEQLAVDLRPKTEDSDSIKETMASIANIATDTSPFADINDDVTQSNVNNKRTFGELYHVNPEAYEGVKLESLRLENRSTNILHRLKCETVKDVLMLSVSQIKYVRQVGSKTIDDVCNKLECFVSLGGNTEEETCVYADQSDDTSVAKILEVSNTNKYQRVGLNDLGFSVRASNALRDAGMNDLSQLLACSMRDLWSLPRIGTTSVKNILHVLNAFLSKTNVSTEQQDVLIVKHNANFKEQIRCMLCGETFDRSDLSEHENAYFNQCIDAKNILGSELCLQAMTGEKNIIELLKMLKEFRRKSQNAHLFKNEIQKLPEFMLDQPICFYLFAYRHSLWIIDRIDRALTISAFPEEISKFEFNSEELVEIQKFLNWLGSDFVSLIHSTLEHCLEMKKQRDIDVLRARACGKTLVGIGESLSMTRQRVRQIEAKIFRIIQSKYRYRKCDIMLIISALRGGDTVLSMSEIKEFFSDDDFQVLWYLVKKNLLDTKYYHYDKNTQAVILDWAIDATDSNDIDEKLPDGMFINEADEIVSRIADGDSHLEELLWIQLKTKYKLSGQYYHRKRITVVQICDYILKNRFQSGYKVSDLDYEKQFRRYMKELYGDVKGLPTMHSIDAKMAEVGVLCDRGKYIHPSYVNVDNTLIDAINQYIADSPRTVLSFDEIFDAMSNTFLGTPITNKYLLQGVLNRYGCPFTTRRDYVTKESSTNMADEVTAFIKANGKLNKSIITDEFSIDDIRLGQVIARCPEVISLDGGYYMHSSELKISENEKEKIREYLIKTCASVPISTRAMLDDFNIQFTDFILNNDIRFHGNLFGILSYLFKGEFYFSRPFISMEDVGNMDSRSVLLQHLDNVESIEIDDLRNLCESVGIRFLTVTNMFASIQPDYIRVSESLVIRNDLVGITDDVIAQTVDNVQTDLELYRYRASNKIDDFSWYPDINVEWTPYLVESIIMMPESNMSYIRIPMGVSNLPSFIFVGEEFAEDDYNSFILKLLKEEHHRDPFSTKQQVLQWLIENGLCYKKLPAFLDDDKHLYLDETGIFKVD